MFVLVKGNLQGATKTAPKSKKFIPICKRALFLNYKHLTHLRQEEALNYEDTKKLATDYNKSAEEFYKIFKDWLRTDQKKFYQFF